MFADQLNYYSCYLLGQIEFKCGVTLQKLSDFLKQNWQVWHPLYKTVKCGVAVSLRVAQQHILFISDIDLI